MSNLIQRVLINLALFILKRYIKDKILVTSASLRSRQVIFLKNVAKLIEFGNLLPGYELTGGEMWRSPEQQAFYYAKGLTKTKYSKHQDRLAIDLNVFVNGIYMSDKETFKPLAEYWKKLHPDNVSGYQWNWDYNHFQMK